MYTLKSRIHTILLLALIGSFTQYLLAQGAPPDTVRMKNGKMNQGWIVDEDYKVLKFRIMKDQPTPIEIKQDNILEVEYGNAPMEFKRGVQCMNEGTYERALHHFKRVRLNQKWLKMYTDYYTAQCWVRLGKHGKALAKLKEITKDPKSKFYIKAWNEIADSYVRQKKRDRAIKTFKEMMQLDALDKSSKNRARLNVYRSYLQKFKETGDKNALNTADKGFAEMLPSISDKNLRKDIEIAQLEIMLLKKEYRKAETKINDLTKRYSGAPITNAQGEILLAKNKYIDARKKFLWTAIYFDSSTEDHNEYLKALYKAAYCFEMLRNVEKNAAQRARKLYNMCIGEGLNREWPKKAKDRLNKF